MNTMKYSLKLMVVLIMLATPSLGFADYQDGKNAFDRMDYSTALREFKLLAERNDPLGQYGLGVMYDIGEGVPQSSSKAAKWYKLAASQGNADAQNNLGAMYEAGEGVPHDSKEAIRWYRLAAEGGNFNAPNNLGAIYLSGIEVPRSRVQAYMWFNIAIQRKDRAAEKNMKFIKPKMYAEQILTAERMAHQWMLIYQNKWKRLR
jgi:TPR repeat protein